MAGVLGLLVFDVLNGYIQAIPNVFVSTIIKCLLVGMIFQSLKKKRLREMRRRNMVIAVLCAAIYGITNIIVDFIWSTVELVVLGSSWSAALAAEITSIPATIHQCRIYSSRNCDSVCSGEEGLTRESLEHRKLISQEVNVIAHMSDNQKGELLSWILQRYRSYYRKQN